jgi:DNA-binding LacI/PurR family transcriptional regulator
MMPVASNGVSSSRPRARAVQTLRAWIEEGKLAGGDRLPSELDLAARMGVARVTVRRALQDLEEANLIRQEGRSRIVTQERPMLLSDAVAVLSDDPTMPDGSRRSGGFEKYIQIAVLEAIDEAGLHAMLLRAERVAGAYTKKLVSEKPRGAVVLGSAARSPVGREVIRHLLAAKVPVACYGGAGAGNSCDSVASDHERGQYEVVRYLIERGCKRILRVWPALAMQEGMDWLKARDAGYERAVREAGLPCLEPICPLIPATGLSNQEVFDLHKRIFAGHLAPHLLAAEPVDALAVVSDGPLIAAAAACRLLGKRPQQDVLLAGYDDYWAESYARAYEPTVPLVTVNKRNAAIGRELLDLVLARAAGTLPAEPQRRLVPPELVIVHAREAAVSHDR